MPGTDRLVVGYRRVPGAWLYALPLAIAVYAVVERSWAAVAWTALTLAQVWSLRRGATVLTTEGISVGVLRRRSVPWSRVRAFCASEASPWAEVVLDDGSAVRLLAVEWFAPRPEGRAPQGSVQAVAEWARAHGHDVPVVAA